MSFGRAKHIRQGTDCLNSQRFRSGTGDHGSQGISGFPIQEEGLRLMRKLWTHKDTPKNLDGLWHDNFRPGSDKFMQITDGQISAGKIPVFPSQTIL
jgi:hypothetical protein